LTPNNTEEEQIISDSTVPSTTGPVSEDLIRQYMIQKQQLQQIPKDNILENGPIRTIEENQMQIHPESDDDSGYDTLKPEYEIENGEISQDILSFLPSEFIFIVRSHWHIFS
jgi:hypothetical protein